LLASDGTIAYELELNIRDWVGFDTTTCASKDEELDSSEVWVCKFDPITEVSDISEL
jgi:hypothetical protein